MYGIRKQYFIGKLLVAGVCSFLMCVCTYNWGVEWIMNIPQYTEYSIKTYMSDENKGSGTIKALDIENQLFDYLVDNTGFSISKEEFEGEMVYCYETTNEDAVINFEIPKNISARLLFENGINNGLGVLISSAENEFWITADELLVGQDIYYEIIAQEPYSYSRHYIIALNIILFTVFFIIFYVSIHLLMCKGNLIVILKKFSKREYILLSIISIMICFLFSDIITEKVYQNAKYADINIKLFNSANITDVPKGSVKIIDNYYLKKDSIDVIKEKKYFYDFNELKDSVVSNVKFELVAKENSEYGFAFFDSQDLDSTIRFRLRVFPTTCITFKTSDTDLGAVVSNLNNGEERWITYTELSLEEIGCIKYYPFELSDYAYIFVFLTAYYLILFFIISLFLCMIYYFFSKKDTRKGFLRSSDYKKMFVILLFLHYSILAIIFAFNKDFFIAGEGSDAFYYMNPDIYNVNGTFSISHYLSTRYNFRGYIPHLLSIVFNYISSGTGINVMYFHYIVTSCISVFTIAIAMPVLYECFLKKKVSNYSILIVWIMFFAFWTGHNFFVLSDIPSAMATVCATAFGLQAIINKRPKRMFLSGLFMGFACCYRINYNYVNYTLMLCLIVYYIVIVYKSKQRMEKKFNLYLTLSEFKILKSILMYFVGVILISTPQFVTNFQQGHLGFFPYASDFEFDINSGKNRGATITLHSYQFNRPYNLDKQTASVDQYFYSDKRYTGGDGLFIVMARPLEFLNNYFKKIFWAMSAAWEWAYYKDKLEFSYLYIVDNLFSIINYALLGTFLFAIVKRNHKILAPGLGLYFGITFLCTVGLQATQHIERRYYLFYYLLIYLFNGFFVGNFVIEDRENAKCYFNWKYVLFLMIFVFTMFELRMTFSDNFVYPLYD